MSLFGEKEKTRLKIKGMTCGHCVGRVTKALEEVDGVKSASVSLENNDAEVVFKKNKIANDVLIKAVEEAGYKAKAQ